MKEMKTITIGDETGNPTYSLCPGHVDAKTFAKAYRAEGWDGFDDPDENDLSHEYWKPSLNGTYVSCGKTDLGALPFTVWDW